MKGGIFLLSREDFIRISLEINLFFQRIMKEHMFFVETGFPYTNPSYAERANILKMSFEEILLETVQLANGAVSDAVLKSNELVTPYTLDAEELTSNATKASINFDITVAELNLMSDPNFVYTQWLEDALYNINMRSINILGEIIAFKKQILNEMLECKIATSLYPTLIEHILREAELYMEMLKALQQKHILKESTCDVLNFWNRIMGEHAAFIEGLLDPVETELKKTAEEFSIVFGQLEKKCRRNRQREIISKSYKATEELMKFKKAGTIGLVECDIKSIILPLLGDHVLREANHYLRLLKMMCK